MHTTQTPELPSHTDLLVVGAGAAGLYTAYRFLDAHPGADVVVLDRLNRPGGRLQSDLVEFEVDGETVVVRDEEGGMRFNYQMTELMALFKALGLCDQVVPFPMAPIEGANHNRYNFRGFPFSVDYAAAHPSVWSELYDLGPGERNRQPVEIITEAYGRIYANSRAALVAPLAAATGQSEAEVEAYLTPKPPAYPTPEYWQAFRIHGSWEGTPLYEWQLWGLLRSLRYTEECVTMLTHALGFEGPFLATTNAGEALQILEDFPANPTYFTFEDGFSTLIDALVQAVEERGGRIFLSTNVDAVEGEGGFRAEVTRAPEDQSATPTVPGGTKAAIEAERVVLALPRKALETLYATSPALNRRHATDRTTQTVADRLSGCSRSTSTSTTPGGRRSTGPSSTGPPLRTCPSTRSTRSTHSAAWRATARRRRRRTRASRPRSRSTATGTTPTSGRVSRRSATRSSRRCRPRTTRPARRRCFRPRTPSWTRRWPTSASSTRLACRSRS